MDFHRKGYEGKLLEVPMDFKGKYKGFEGKLHGFEGKLLEAPVDFHRKLKGI